MPSVRRGTREGGGARSEESSRPGPRTGDQEAKNGTGERGTENREQRMKEEDSVLLLHSAFPVPRFLFASSASRLVIARGAAPAHLAAEY